MWVALPASVRDYEVESRAAARGILVSAGHHWHSAEPAAPYLRLSFAGVQPEWVDGCIAELAEIVGEMVPTRVR